MNAIEASDAYTVFAPNNAAIESYIREKKAATLVGIGTDDQGTWCLETQTLDILQLIHHVSFPSSTETSFPHTDAYHKAIRRRPDTHTSPRCTPELPIPCI